MYKLFVDSSNSVDIFPEYDYKEEDEKEQAVHRTPSGRRYVYKFGSWQAFKFSLRYVNSADTQTLNAWWLANTKLLFAESGSTDVTSVIITNDKKPIGDREKPYTNQFRGTLELETY